MGVAPIEVESLGCVDIDGNEINMSYSEQRNAIKEQGCWGFADTKYPVIHVWTSPECEMSTLVHMLAHERAHQLYPIQVENNDEFLKEELTVEYFGEVARFAYVVAMQILGAGD